MIAIQEENEVEAENYFYYSEPSQDKSEPEEESRVNRDFNSFIPVDQNTVITMDPRERTIVNAGPGTGKTWALIEKIKYMLGVAGVNPENILVLCFSRAAVEVIRTRLESAAADGHLPINWHLIEVRTFDSFATYVLSWLMENEPTSLPENYLLEKEGYDDRIRTIVNVFVKERDMLDGYEHVIVDEIQDLVGVRAELVLAVLHSLPQNCGFTLTGDSCQAIYDYLVEKEECVLSSNGFYQQLFNDFNTAKYFSFTENYRQESKFGNLSLPYRNAIISADSGEKERALSDLNERISSTDIQFSKIDREDLLKYVRQGTLGILTRTNAQALQIAAWLQTAGIAHQLLAPNRSPELSGWIFAVLSSSDSDMIDYREFAKLFELIYPNCNKADISRYWTALIVSQRDPDRNHFEIADLLKGILENAKDPLLYKEPGRKETTITVSNIHRAKGREYDSVLILEDVLSVPEKSADDNELEHKVCYVAVTRPRKCIEKVSWKKQYISQLC